MNVGADEIIAALVQSEEIRLYEKATNSDHIGLERFERNLRPLRFLPLHPRLSLWSLLKESLALHSSRVSLSLTVSITSFAWRLSTIRERNRPRTLGGYLY